MIDQVESSGDHFCSEREKTVTKMDSDTLERQKVVPIKECSPQFRKEAKEKIVVGAKPASQLQNADNLV
jgi:hypothetical protein